MSPVLRKRNMRSVDKEKYITRARADVPLTYYYETISTERLDTRLRASYVFSLVGVTHVTFTQVDTYCSAFGTRLDSIMAALWNQRISLFSRTLLWHS